MSICPKSFIITASLYFAESPVSDVAEDLYDREVEVLLTTDSCFGSVRAEKLLALLYPNRHIADLVLDVL